MLSLVLYAGAALVANAAGAYLAVRWAWRRGYAEALDHSRLVWLHCKNPPPSP